jgi:hypothetical protein
VIEIVEFMHPRADEIADTMPAAVGRWMLRNRIVKALLMRLTSRGRKVRTTSLRGFLLLYGVASSRRSDAALRHQREMRFLDEWLERVYRAAGTDFTAIESPACATSSKDMATLGARTYQVSGDFCFHVREAASSVRHAAEGVDRGGWKGRGRRRDARGAKSIGEFERGQRDGR